MYEHPLTKSSCVHRPVPTFDSRMIPGTLVMPGQSNYSERPPRQPSVSEGWATAAFDHAYREKLFGKKSLLVVCVRLVVFPSNPQTTLTDVAVDFSPCLISSRRQLSLRYRWATFCPSDCPSYSSLRQLKHPIPRPRQPTSSRGRARLLPHWWTTYPSSLPSSSFFSDECGRRREERATRSSSASVRPRCLTRVGRGIQAQSSSTWTSTELERVGQRSASRERSDTGWRWSSLARCASGGEGRAGSDLLLGRTSPEDFWNAQYVLPLILQFSCAPWQNSC